MAYDVVSEPGQMLRVQLVFPGRLGLLAHLVAEQRVDAAASERVHRFCRDGVPVALALPRVRRQFDMRRAEREELRPVDRRAAHDRLTRCGLHAIPADPSVPPLSPIQSSLRYLALLDERALPASRERIAARLARLKSGQPSCIVHGDLIPENFLLSNGGLYLVDWEYAGIGFPEIDLALTIANFELDEDRAKFLLDAYGKVDHQVLADMKVAAIIREALWCVAQASFGTVSEDLVAYTELCNQRLRSVLR